MPKGCSIIEDIYRWTAIVVFAAIPLFFLPLTQNFYDTGKWMLVACFGLVTILFWVLRVICTKKITASFSPVALVFGALTITSGISILFASTNKVEAMISPIGIVTMATFTVFYLLAGNLMNEYVHQRLRWAMAASAGILSLVAVYMFFGLGKLMFPGVAFLADPLWTPSGSSLVTATILMIMIPVILHEALIQIAKKNDLGISVSAVLFVLTVTGFGLTVYNLVPRLASSMLPPSVGWTTLLEMYKQPKSALVGVGLENFIGAFTAARPATMNTGPLWNIRFVLSSNAFFHMATTMGIFGIAALILLIMQLIIVPNVTRWELRVALAVGAVSLILTPPHIVIFSLIAALLMLKNVQKSYILNWNIPEHIKWIGTGVTLVAICVILASTWGLYKVYAAERAFYESLVAAAANDGTKTYNLQIKALVTNPYIANYHVSYSQTNIALANSITQTATATPGGQLSENDRQLVSQLIQQAIREAKLATNLDPVNVIPWETLARTYRSIMGSVNGADTWAVAAYQRAIQLDPSNPILRMELGGVYTIQKDFESAARELQTGILLKPDMANLPYNLSFVWGQLKDYYKQALALKQTLTLIPAGSEDAKTVQKEYEAARAKLSKDQLTSLDQVISGATVDQTPLSQPQQEPQPQITPKIELPESSSPSSAVHTQKYPEEATRASFPR